MLSFCVLLFLCVHNRHIQILCRETKKKPPHSFLAGTISAKCSFLLSLTFPCSTIARSTLHNALHSCVHRALHALSRVLCACARPARVLAARVLSKQYTHSPTHAHILIEFSCVEFTTLSCYNNNANECTRPFSRAPNHHRAVRFSASSLFLCPRSLCIVLCL